MLAEVHLLDLADLHCEWLNFTSFMIRSSTAFTDVEHRSIIQIPIMACCVLLMDIFSNTESNGLGSHIAYLGMASGWFGRLAIMSKYDFAFRELMELISLAQSYHKTKIAT